MGSGRGEQRFWLGIRNRHFRNLLEEEIARREYGIVERVPGCEQSSGEKATIAIVCNELLENAEKGRRIVEAMRCENPSIRVVLIARQPSWVSTRLALLAGACDFVAMELGAPVVVSLALGGAIPAADAPAFPSEAIVLAHYRRLILQECGGSKSRAARLLGRAPYSLRRSLRADSELLDDLSIGACEGDSQEANVVAHLLSGSGDE